jgi:GNAT superfamily N-acetyltransferase
MRFDFHTEDGEPTSQSFEEFSENYGRFLSGALESGQWYVWVAEFGGEVVSHIFTFVVPKVPRPSETAACWGYLTNVYTVPSHRGLGVGTELLNKVIDWAKTKHLELLLVWPSEDSMAFYERSGFKSNEEIHELKLNDLE